MAFRLRCHFVVQCAIAAAVDWGGDIRIARHAHESWSPDALCRHGRWAGNAIVAALHFGECKLQGGVQRAGDGDRHSRPGFQAGHRAEEHALFATTGLKLGRHWPADAGWRGSTRPSP